MPLNFISGVRTISDTATPMFPGKSGLNIKWVTLKARTNGITILSNLEESDGFTIAEGASFDLPSPLGAMMGGTMDLNTLFWRNTTPGSACVIEIIGQRMV